MVVNAHEARSCRHVAMLCILIIVAAILDDDVVVCQWPVGQVSGEKNNLSYEV